MRTRVLSVASLFAALLAAAPAPADGASLLLQGTLSVSPGVLTAGDEATIRYSDPAMAGQRIVVTIAKSVGDRREAVTVTITLDADGNGSATWLVPNWDSAVFSAPGAADVRRAVV